MSNKVEAQSPIRGQPRSVPESARRDRDRRRSARHPIPRTLVTLEAPGVSHHPWVANAVDISPEGLGLVMPSEIAPGSRILLSFRLDDETGFSRVSSVVVHRELGVGGVEFRRWPGSARTRLMEFLKRQGPGAER